MSADQEIIYKTTAQGDLKFHIYKPDEGEERPAVIFFFGGGWIGGTPEQFYPHCEHLKAKGFVAISAEYRTEGGHGTSPKACVEDGKSAIRYLYKHAADLGINPQQILAGGGSAGAHVAAACANVDGFEDPQDDLAFPCRPKALILFNPVFDNSENGYGYERVKDYWEAFSPMHNLGPHSPPTVIFLGTNDDLIPVSTAEKYRDIMQEYGQICELHLYEGAKHGFFNPRPDDDFYERTIADMDAFLESLPLLHK